MATSRPPRQPRTQTVRAPKPPKTPQSPKPMSATQRNKLATKGIAAALGIPTEGEKVAVTAALEAVNERLAADTDLRETVRQKYQEITALSAGTGQKPGASQQPDLGPTPIPIRTTGTPEDYNPYAGFDPYRLQWRYGDHQMRAVLVRGTQRDLREAVDIVQARNPGTAPRSKSNNADMVDYIMEYVVGPGH